MTVAPPQTLSLDIALQHACAHHQAGRLSEAEQLYRAILQVLPKQPDANHNLGILATQVGQHEAGLPFLKTAWEINRSQEQYVLSYAETLLVLGRYKAALNTLESSVRHGLKSAAIQTLHQRARIANSKNPAKDDVPTPAELDYLIVLFNAGRYLELENRALGLIERHPQVGLIWKALGASLKMQGKDSLSAFQRGVELLPDDFEGYMNLGNTLKDRGRFESAVANYGRALDIRKDVIDAYFNLAEALHGTGRLDEAASTYRCVLDLNSDYAQAHNNLGIVLQSLGKFDSALVSFRRALEIKADFSEAYNNVGLALQSLGRLQDAMASYRRALELNPNFAEAYNNLGIALQCRGQFETAIACHRKAVELAPGFPRAHLHLGSALQALGKFTEAEECYRQALKIEPNFADAHCNLGILRQECGDFDGAIANYRRAVDINPAYAAAHGNLLFCLNYHPDLSAEVIFTEYRHWNEVHARPLIEAQVHLNTRDTERRLRVGYISPDLRKHPVQYFIEPILARHDKSLVEIYAYAEVAAEDAVSARFKGYVDHWRNTVGIGDQALAEIIRQDQIDILVDLAGHTAGNRLLVLARKPAPIQVSWLGYGYTTGMDAIDYWVGDAELAPSGSDSLFAEDVVRLPVFTAYRPAEGMGEAGQLPATQTGGVTFGTLSRSVRINHHVIRAWAEILNRLPDSRLIINSRDFQSFGMQTRIRQQFAAHGVDGARLEIGFESPPWDVLRKIDIALDCFPHNSGTTLIESLYLGVPYITLRDRPSVGRIGASLLKALGRTEWIADNEEEYIERALALASDIDRLANVRSTLRQQLEASVLMDEAGFARAIESAYRTMWQCWCSENQDMVLS